MLYALDCATGTGRFMWCQSIFQYKDNPDPYLSRLDSMISMVGPGPMLIGADSNAHSTMWFEDETKDFLRANGLMVINEPSLLTMDASSQGTSNVNVTIVSGDVARWVEDWGVFGCTVSDHWLLTYHLWGSAAEIEGHTTLAQYRVKTVFFLFISC